MTGFSVPVPQGRGPRRAVVLVTYAALLVVYVLVVAAKVQGLPWLRAAAAPAGLLACAGYSVLYRFTRRYAIRTCDTDGFAPDERDAGVRDRAMSRAYLVVGAGLIAFIGWMSIAAEDPRYWTPRTSSDWIGVLVAVQLVMSSLPQAMITWEEPDVEDFQENPVRPGVGR